MSQDPSAEDRLRTTLGRFTIGTLILTYRCPLACRMCFFGANPNRREMLDEDVARRFISDAAKLGVPNIGFAGGEPVLRLDLLCDLISQCRELGVRPIVITSGYWGRSPMTARRTTERLRRAGLDWIQLSLDEDHLEFMEMEAIAGALIACREAGFEDIKVIGTSRGNKGNFADLVFYVEHVMGASTGGVDLVDRFRISHGSYRSEQTTYALSDLEKCVRRPGCLTEMMVDVNADVYPCCQNFVGPIGNLLREDLESVLRRVSPADSPFSRFHEIGPLSLARELDQTEGTSFAAQRYGCWCEVCSRIFADPRFRTRLQGSALVCPAPARLACEREGAGSPSGCRDDRRRRLENSSG